MTPAIGLHNVTLAYVPGMTPRPAPLPPLNHRPILTSRAILMLRTLKALTHEWQPVNDVVAASQRRRDGVIETLTKMRRNGLAETMRSKPGGITLWRITAKGADEREWHRRYGR